MGSWFECVTITNEYICLEVSPFELKYSKTHSAKCKQIKFKQFLDWKPFVLNKRRLCIKRNKTESKVRTNNRMYKTRPTPIKSSIQKQQYSTCVLPKNIKGINASIHFPHVWFSCKQSSSRATYNPLYIKELKLRWTLL